MGKEMLHQDQQTHIVKTIG